MANEDCFIYLTKDQLNTLVDLVQTNPILLQGGVTIKEIIPPEMGIFTHLIFDNGEDIDVTDFNSF